MPRSIQSKPANRKHSRAADADTPPKIGSIAEINAAGKEALRNRGENVSGWRKRGPRLSEETLAKRREYNRLNSLNPF